MQSNDKQKQEQKAGRQRHSVEVTNAGNYLHIQPSTLETLTRSAANANANRNRKKQETTIKEEVQANGKLGSLPEFQTVAILPPALKSLVFLWEELSTSCLQTIDHESVLPSPTQMQTMKLSKRPMPEKRPREDKLKERDKKENRKKKDWKPVGKDKWGRSARWNRTGNDLRIVRSNVSASSYLSHENDASWLRGGTQGARGTTAEETIASAGPETVAMAEWVEVRGTSSVTRVAIST